MLGIAPTSKDGDAVWQCRHDHSQALSDRLGTARKVYNQRVSTYSTNCTRQHCMWGFRYSLSAHCLRHAGSLSLYYVPRRFRCDVAGRETGPASRYDDVKVKLIGPVNKRVRDLFFHVGDDRLCLDRRVELFAN